ncbi:related to retrotransposon HobS hobase [Fusarium oxysporum]|uniref:Related to retrotransposon HobS hobase n=1 Tax=Fusarium oxysporum TaxID=5507 RepID=A0A2H3SQN2_FUSOX|nr:related to retrotransposon HobS hobase [Fusarium oxysporum]
MPILPKRHKDLKNHLLGDIFREAEKTHLKSHKEIHAWREVQRGEAAGKELLDCMWVYVYKFDKHEWFTECKARLVIQGDQQAKSAHEDTYASTLAGRSFRTLMAIAAHFDLELIQYDIINAFINAKLKQDVYMQMPRGYQKARLILKLQKALYSLHQSPLLWEKELTTTLTNLGFKPIPHEPCCLLKEGIMIFFYVDDLIVAYKKRNQDMVDWMIGKL